VRHGHGISRHGARLARRGRAHDLVTPSNPRGEQSRVLTPGDGIFTTGNHNTARSTLLYVDDTANALGYSYQIRPTVGLATVTKQRYYFISTCPISGRHGGARRIARRAETAGFMYGHARGIQVCDQARSSELRSFRRGTAPRSQPLLPGGAKLRIRSSHPRLNAVLPAATQRSEGPNAFQDRPSRRAQRPQALEELVN